VHFACRARAAPTTKWLAAKTPTAISSCKFHDNGIGFRESLLLGPQSTAISTKIGNTGHNDGDYIALATDENVSGAFDASVKYFGLKGKRFRKGKRRGNGLARIIEKCALLNIRMTLVSHFGHVFLDAKGKITQKVSHKNRVFGGTLYNFIVPCR
jgi:hypothetical protein